MKRRSRRLREMTSRDVASVDKPILVVPIGSCEQHGPHLPVGTDSIVAEALCDAIATANVRVVIGPTLTVTSSGEHAGFPGTLSVGSPVTSSMVVELVRSADWASSVVLVNGHGGNVAAVQDAVETLRAEARNVTEWWPRVADGDAHAGNVETSIMLHLAKHLVNMELAEVGNTRPLGEIAGALRSNGLRAVSPNGVLGDPRTATARAGSALMDQLVQQLTDHIANLHG